MDAGISLDEAIELTRTGDIWIFRGRTGPDRAIRALTNSPVNHVGMSRGIDDMPSMMWHAELGRSLPDLWSGTFHRGVQLHDLRDAVCVWANRYGQRAWMRQLEPAVTKEAEDQALRTVARLDGTPFPSSAQMAWRWVRGRVPQIRPPWRAAPEDQADLETAYCAEVVAVTYEDMGLLPGGRPASWYDPGRFWSGDNLDLCDDYHLGTEIAVDVPAT
ncbi:MAG TPA: hypothetical protein VFH03_09125 [Actinoplanes sp.]|nr:hypothetical protein [Actinoplanes sp.]